VAQASYGASPRCQAHPGQRTIFSLRFAGRVALRAAAAAIATTATASPKLGFWGLEAEVVVDLESPDARAFVKEKE
jgi:hypothetical protein